MTNDNSKIRSDEIPTEWKNGARDLQLFREFKVSKARPARADIPVINILKFIPNGKVVELPEKIKMRESMEEDRQRSVMTERIAGPIHSLNIEEKSL